MSKELRRPPLHDPHYQAWKHISDGGRVLRYDRLNKVCEWLSVEQLGHANDILLYGYRDLFIAPEDASDFTYDGFTVKFYRRVSALGMNLLDYWSNGGWRSAGTLPWAGLQPVPTIEVDDEPQAETPVMMRS